MMVCGKLPKVSESAKRKLLHCVCSNDLISLEKLIKRNEDLLSAEYQFHDHQNILIIACNDIKGFGKNKGTDGINGETISKLIELGALCTQPTKHDHWEAIHYAAINANKIKLNAIVKHLTVEQANSLVYCSKLVSTKFPFASDFPKSYSNNALHILLKYGRRTYEFRQCCEILIQKGVSLSQQDSNGVTPLDLLKKEEDVSDLVALRDSQVIFGTKTAFQLIQLNREREFLSSDFNKEALDDVDGPTDQLSSCTLLQICCEKGLSKCVKYILEKGGSPNKTVQKSTDTPLMIAIQEDYEEIVQLLLDNKIEIPEDILVKIQFKYKHLKNFIKVDKYMTMLLEHIDNYKNSKRRKYLLAVDELDRTALHYAVQYRSSQNVLKLLSMGAPLTKKDIFGYSPLNSIDPSLLKSFLDSCIVISKDNEMDMENVMFILRNSKKKFSLEIDYGALTSESDDCELKTDDQEALKKVRKVRESEFLYQIFQTQNLRDLVNHPVVLSYLEVKWHKFRYVVYSNLFVYLMAYIFLLCYGFSFNKYSKVYSVFLFMALVIISIRQLVQLVIFRFKYLKHLENVIDLFLIGGIIYTTASIWMLTLTNQNLKVAYSVVFLTSTWGMFMQVGKLPYFAIKVIILKQTSLSFFKYMIFYAFPILAFFFCFYMLNEDEDDLFYQILYDVITMFAGDPDSNYPSQFVTNPIFGHIIYICFAILIGVILQNLLIGLAVSDLQEIHEQAKFIRRKERADYITGMEKIIISDAKSSSWLSRSIFETLLKAARIFKEENILVIQPYNDGCVYPKNKKASKEFIKDKNIINVLQTILKNLTMDAEVEASYVPKAIHERLDRIESLLEKQHVSSC